MSNLTGTVYFWNGTDQLLLVHVEAEDISQGDEEGHVVRGEEDPANSLQAWLDPAVPDMSIYPKQQIAVDFTIDVPENADPGSHWAGSRS